MAAKQNPEQLQSSKKNNYGKGHTLKVNNRVKKEGFFIGIMEDLNKSAPNVK